MSAQVMRHLCERLSTLIMIVCVLILSSLIAINALEITLRSFFSTSLSWIFETNTLLASWLYFLGIAIIYHKGKDITVTAVQERLPSSLQRLYGRAMQLITAAVYIGCAWYAWRLIELQWPFRTPGVGYPRAAFTLPLLIGLAVVALECLRRVLDPQEPAPAASAHGDLA